MAATELFKESPDGHANSMGTCYSAGKKKTPNSSSFSSSRSPESDARRTQNSTQPAPRSSSTGKAHRTQTSCLNNSEQALGRSASTGKDCRTSLVANGSVTSANQAHTNASSTANAIHARHISRNSNLSDGKKHDAQMHHTYTTGNVSDTGSASSGFVAGTSTAISTHTDTLHTLPSTSKASPHKFNSLSLKSGIGPYEVLTPRKPIAGLQGTTPRKSGQSEGDNTRKIGRATQSSSKGDSFPPSGTKDQGTKELCKNCKTSNWDSVCFIANDGRIAAANTGPATICHFHHCNSPKCAANPKYHPPSSLKILLSKTRSVPCQPWRRL